MKTFDALYGTLEGAMGPSVVTMVEMLLAALFNVQSRGNSSGEMDGGMLGVVESPVVTCMLI